MWMVTHASGDAPGRSFGGWIPLAEVVIVAAAFFGIVCLDAAMEVASRVLFQAYSIAGAVERMEGEARLERLLRGYVAEEALLRADSEWSADRESLLSEHSRGRERRMSGGQTLLATTQSGGRSDACSPWPRRATSPALVDTNPQEPK